MIRREFTERRLAAAAPHGSPSVRNNAKSVSNACVDHSADSALAVSKDSKPFANGCVVDNQAAVCNGNRVNNGRSSAQYRQKALQEIRISLLPFMNNERPVSSASSASDSSSSPGQTSGIGSSISSTSNQSYCNANPSMITDAANGNLKDLQKIFHILLTLGYTEQ
ncbi:hypothetical protein B4U80_07001 [Leptotrombidium deliense]|uniref:Uncharacterized protein n=1 Tax=Leptotrombidium deliense TaxID=299467 RepID=A0A443SVB7_9ACAR|nr:hypothetical protein B4U80_07001 [Leptotrombidium deliense]